jgi:acyl-CoA thioesterase
LSLRPSEDGHWRATADPRYQSINAVFGGWTAAVALLGVTGSATGSAAPSAITINFISKIEPGTPVIVRPHRVGGGRSIHHWQCELVSAEGQLLAQAMVVLAERRDSDGVTQPDFPDGPDPESLDEFHPPGTMGERMVHRPISGYPPYGREDTSSTAWVRDTTGRRVDHAQLAFLADAYAPRSFFWSDGPRPSASITLSVYFHGTDPEIASIGDDYVLTEAIGTRGASSTSGQYARIWSRSGALVATSEQLCWFR